MTATINFLYNTELIVHKLNIIRITKRQLMATRTLALLIFTFSFFTATAQVTNMPAEDQTSATAPKKKALIHPDYFSGVILVLVLETSPLSMFHRRWDTG